MNAWFGEGHALVQGANTANNDNRGGGAPIVSPATDRVYQTYTMDPGQGANYLGFLIREASTLKIVGSFRLTGLNGLSPEFENIPQGTLPLAFDPDGRRMFLRARVYRQPGSLPPPNANPAFLPSGLITIAEDDLTLSSKPRAAEPAPHRFTPLGVSYGNPDGDPRVNEITGITYVDGKLYAMSQAGTRASVAELDPDTGAVRWHRFIRGCSEFWHESVQGAHRIGYPAILVTDEDIIVPCVADATATVVRIPRSEVADPGGTEEVFRGQGVPIGYLVDEAVGRVHMIVRTPTDVAVLTFDGQVRGYVGLQRAGARGGGNAVAGAGLDEATGRVYTLTTEFQSGGVDRTDGLSLIEGRRTPVVPGLRFRQYTFVDGPSVLPVDPKRGRVYVPSEDGATVEAMLSERYRVIETQPPAEQPETPDPDSNTQAVEKEDPTVTGVTLSAEGAGYGLRQIYVGGLRGIANRDFASTSMERFYQGGPCYWNDREIVTGRVSHARMAGTLRSAQAAAASGDAFTRQDVETPSRCREPGTVSNEQDPMALLPGWVAGMVDQMAASSLDNAARPWPYETAACRPDEPESEMRPTDPALRASYSRVGCDDDQVTARAEFRSADTEAVASSHPMPVTVGWSASVASLQRDPKRGIVSVVESFVRDVNIGGVISIEGVYAKAEAWAHGRPETADTRFTRVIMGVRGPDFACRFCATPEQQQQMVDGMNRALAGRGIEVRLPNVDATLAEGTPGGYQAAIQRDEFEAMTTRLLNGDDLAEVPALEIIRYNDTVAEGRQRQIYQFAGTKVNAQYGVFCFFGLPTGGKCPRPAAPPSFSGAGSAVDPNGSSGPPSPDSGPMASTDGFIGQTQAGLGGSEYWEDVGGALPTASLPASGGGRGDGGLLPTLLGLPGDALRLLLRDPAHALLFAASMLLLGAPLWVARRRALLVSESSSLLR